MKRLLIFFILILPALGVAQDPLRFAEEVEKFKNINQEYDIVFTGSSSIRLWKTLQSDFPDMNLINTGFGGSQTSDLIHYYPLLIEKYKPKKLFIYEGDNDIAEGKSPEEAMKDMKKLYSMIREELPDTEVYFISPKPSLKRIHLKDQYEALNAMLKSYCDSLEKVQFIDVWNPMFDEQDLKTDIFIEDSLHMNPKGYGIWTEVIGPFVED